MRVSTSIDEQLAAVRNDRLRVLIAGAGVAGLTLAAALRVDGLHPVVVEKAAEDGDVGYMLALMPLIDPLFDRIGVTQEYRNHSVPLSVYRMHDRHGRVIHEYPMGELLDIYGEYRGISRGDLLAVLTSNGVPVTFETTISVIRQTGETVVATFSDGAEAEFDLVVAADGLHSGTRELVLRPEQVPEFDTGWGGWIAWSDVDPKLDGVGDEIWGAGYFLGLYPVQGRIGAFLGGDRKDTKAGAPAFVERVREELEWSDWRIDRALEAMASGDDLYFWRLVDCRAETWSVGRVALVGDAAAGFLPTAGIGAAMAMESVGVLAQRLAGVDRGDIPRVLREYEAAQRPRVEAAQGNSRRLARLMFHRSDMVAAVRDVASRFIPLDMALGPIRNLLDESPLT